MKKTFISIILILSLLPVTGFAEKETTRIEFIAKVMNELKLDDIPSVVEIADMDANDANYRAAAAAMHNGIINGYGGGYIKPNRAIKREDALLLLCRAFNVKTAADLYLAGIADRAEISDYAKGAASAVVHNSILGPVERLNPGGHLTSAEADELIAAFKLHSKKQLSFSYGYPRLSGDTAQNKITVEIKTTLPCEIYYKLLPSDTYPEEYMPAKSEINTFLTSVAIADSVVDAHINPEDNREYRLYIMAVDNAGNRQTLAVIKEVKAHTFSVGDGSKENPYKIYDEEQLRSIKYHPESYFSLERDIELTEPWQPMDINLGGVTGFSGELNGNYHKITNLQITDTDDNVGFFREIRGGRVTKLYLDGTVYGRHGVGIIAGKNVGGSIEECFVTGRVHATGNNAGAIAGINEGNIVNSVAAAYMVEASGYAGGIAGSNNGGDIENSISAVYSVSSEMYASSVASVNVGGRIKNTVSANMYADDIMTVKNGRITTNKEGGICENNYCYDKMLSDPSVSMGTDTHDGIEVSWQDLTSAGFYSAALGWDTRTLWAGGLNEHFRLPVPSGFGKTGLIRGITMYSPVIIDDKEQLMAVANEPDMHYILTEDIDLDGEGWVMIAEEGTADDGFGGSFDGNGHTIANLHIGKKSSGSFYGMFGVISSGTVRNLTLDNLTIEGESLAGGIAAENYGYIENCHVNGKLYALRKDNMLSVGGICGNNYGFIENSTANVKIRADGQVLTIGGIVANNEGYVNNTAFTGSLNAELSAEHSNAVAGGTCGINMGVLYNSSADSHIIAKASTNYVGGIVGIADSGEIYKTAATGNAVIYSKAYPGATAYAGGVAGLAPEGLIMNSFSSMNITAETNTAYVGGVVGYNMRTSVQSTYAANDIDVTAKKYSMDAPCFAAGISGYSEGGFISDSVAANGRIISNGIAAAVGNSLDENAGYVNNYALSTTVIGGVQYEFSENGNKVGAEAMKSGDFFFKPIAEGGSLGWTEGDVWYGKNGSFLPQLVGVN